MKQPKPELSQKAINKIEDICEQGCTQVNEILEKVENGRQPDELSSFNAIEKSQIIDELTQIMAIYETDDPT